MDFFFGMILAVILTVPSKSCRNIRGNRTVSIKYIKIFILLNFRNPYYPASSKSLFIVELCSK